MEIGNDSQSGDDYFVSSYLNLYLHNGVNVEDFFWHLNDSTGTALSSDDLPTTAPVLSDWDDNRLYISGGPRETKFWFDATVTSAEIIPEPGTLLLLLLGAALLKKRA